MGIIANFIIHDSYYKVKGSKPLENTFVYTYIIHLLYSELFIKI